MTIDIKDVVKVIKACKASGVSKMKLGDLELEFSTGEAEKVLVPATGEAVETPSAEQLKEIEDRASMQERADDVDEKLALMQVDDPEGFEELLVQRELTDGGKRAEFQEADNRRIESVL